MDASLPGARAGSRWGTAASAGHPGPSGHVHGMNTAILEYMGMDQYLLIPFLMGWTSIYQLFWGSLGARVLTHPHILAVMAPGGGNMLALTKKNMNYIYIYATPQKKNTIASVNVNDDNSIYNWCNKGASIMDGWIVIIIVIIILSRKKTYVAIISMSGDVFIMMLMNCV